MDISAKPEIVAFFRKDRERLFLKKGPYGVSFFLPMGQKIFRNTYFMYGYSFTISNWEFLDDWKRFCINLEQKELLTPIF